MPTVTKSAFIFGCLLAGGVAAAGLIRSSFLIITVNGNSMKPTLEPNSRLLILRRWPTRWLQHNQLVVLSYPPIDAPSQSSSLFIKRITNLPGETFITHLADLPKLWQERERHRYNKTGEKIWTIPPDHYFVRADSVGVDSLIWGPLPLTSLIGIVVARLPLKFAQQLSTLLPHLPLPNAKRRAT